MNANAGNIENREQAGEETAKANGKPKPQAATKKRQISKKKTDLRICREGLAMHMFQKAMEALEAIDISSLSATNIVHLLEIAAKLEKISGESNNQNLDDGEGNGGAVQIYLPDNRRDS